MTELVNHPKVRRFKLNVDTLETLDDIKKVLEVLDIRIQTDSDLWEKVGQHFTTECVPRGYLKLREKIGDKGIANLHYHEMEIEIQKILDEEKTT